MLQKNYISRGSKLLKNFDKSISRVRPVLVARYGKK